MAEHNNLGRVGEERAVAYLLKAGYVILERNWRLKHREIDVICTDGELIIIVEVKTRYLPEEYPGEMLDYRKKRNLLSAGAAYIRQKGIEKELRFDLIVVTGADYEILHIQEAIQITDI